VEQETFGRLLNITTLLSAALVVMVMASLRKAHIRVEYSVSWLAAAALLLGLSRAGGLLAWIAGWMGIRQPPMALLAIALGVFLLVFFRFSVIISALKDNNIALAQKLAILEYRIERLSDNGDEERKAALES